MATSNSFFFRNLPELPDFDDEDLDQKMADISVKDCEILAQINMFSSALNWHEKLALGLNAYWSIDGTERQLCTLTPTHGEYSPELKSAIALLRHLSPQAKAEMATEIIGDDWELGGEE